MSLPMTFFSESPPLFSLPSRLSHVVENIDSILIDQTVSSRHGGTRCYLVKWRERLGLKFFRLLRRIFDGLVLIYLSITVARQPFPSPHSTESSFSHPWGNDEDIMCCLLILVILICSSFNLVMFSLCGRLVPHRLFFWSWTFVRPINRPPKLLFWIID